MSIALYATRLYWSDGRGVAKFDGQELRLAACPQILQAVVVDAIDYAPGVVAMFMPRFGGWTEMDGAQRAACDGYLRQLFGAERRAP